MKVDMTGKFKGEVSEEIASRYLVEEGYEIKERNFRSGKSEIDIIAKDGNFLVFVEVKSRRTTKFGYPEDSITRSKFAALARGAETYRKQIEWSGPFRFDAVSIVFGETTDLKHLKDIVV